MNRNSLYKVLRLHQREGWTHQQPLLYLSWHARGTNHHVGQAGVTWCQPQHIPKAFCSQDAYYLCSARRLVENGHNLCCGPDARELHHAAVRTPGSIIHPSMHACTQQPKDVFTSHCEVLARYLQPNSVVLQAGRSWVKCDRQPSTMRHHEGQPTLLMERSYVQLWSTAKYKNCSERCIDCHFATVLHAC